MYGFCCDLPQRANIYQMRRNRHRKMCQSCRSLSANFYLAFSFHSNISQQILFPGFNHILAKSANFKLQRTICYAVLDLKEILIWCLSTTLIISFSFFFWRKMALGWNLSLLDSYCFNFRTAFPTVFQEKIFFSIIVFLNVEFVIISIFRTEYFFPEADNQTSWLNSSMGNLTGEPYLIVIGTALRTNKHYYKVWKSRTLFFLLLNECGYGKSGNIRRLSIVLFWSKAPACASLNQQQNNHKKFIMKDLLVQNISSIFWDIFIN